MTYDRMTMRHLFSVFVVVLVSGVVTFLREVNTGGPHHDEVIALMASKGLEREWVRMSDANELPLHAIVAAVQWHRYTRDFALVPFTEIRADVMSWDKHPPMAFWVMNGWLSMFQHGGYRQALILTWLQLVIAAAILGFTAFRCCGSIRGGLIAFTVFLAGNSAIFTGAWMRQYALFMVFFSLLVLAAAELAGRDISLTKFLGWATVAGMASLLGMMCQYTFITMTGPIHLALLVLLVSRREWQRFAILAVGYVIAAGLFFALLPGVIRHASAVSHGLERKWQLIDALRGMPRMYIPLPSNLPVAIICILGVLALFVPVMISLMVMRQSNSREILLADARISMFGMLGAGLFQFLMVTVGYFPGWATSENHMCAFWLLTVLAATKLIADWPWKKRMAIVSLALVSMLGMQSLYIWHTHRILPRLNTSYISSEGVDLVCVDNLARGFVLQVTDLMHADSLVLATDSRRIADRFAERRLPSRILYLPMDTTVHAGKADVLNAATAAGYRVVELPVIHTGMYEAILIQKLAD